MNCLEVFDCDCLVHSFGVRNTESSIRYKSNRYVFPTQRPFLDSVPNDKKWIVFHRHFQILVPGAPRNNSTNRLAGVSCYGKLAKNHLTTRVGIASLLAVSASGLVTKCRSMQAAVSKRTSSRPTKKRRSKPT
jgi:hypothetical protein